MLWPCCTWNMSRRHKAWRRTRRYSAPSRRENPMDDQPAVPSAPSASARTIDMAHGPGCACLSRRSFLTSAAATGLAGFRAEAVAQTPPAAQRIDVHHHMRPPAYIEKRLAQGVGEGSTEVSQWTPARTLEQMDHNGIATAVLSLSQPGINFDDVDGTRSMLRYCNEYGAETVRNHPGRFGLF